VCVCVCVCVCVWVLQTIFTPDSHTHFGQETLQPHESASSQALPPTLLCRKNKPTAWQTCPSVTFGGRELLVKVFRSKVMAVDRGASECIEVGI
jgi:hypothetical protein